MNNMRVAAMQMQHAPGEKETNLGKIEDFVRRAAKQKVELISFPEMCITGYWHLRRLPEDQIRSLAEPVPNGPSSRRLQQLAAECNLIVGAGLIEETPDGTMYNAYVVALPDGRTFCHRKIHSFISEYIDSGSEYTVFDLANGTRIGVLTCYDNNIIENARITALMGAEVLLAPHQTGGCDSKSPGAMGLIDVELWENRHENPEAIEAEFRGPKGRGWLMRWLPSRAHDNGMFLIFSNGVGYDDGEVRTGNAMILDPYGEILVETWRADDEMVISDLDAGRLERCTGQRWMQTRRPELYSPLLQSTGKERSTRTVRFDMADMPD